MKRAIVDQIMLWFLLISAIIVFLGTSIDERAAVDKFLKLQSLNDKIIQVVAKHYMMNSNTCDAQSIADGILNSSKLGQSIGGSCTVSYAWHPSVATPSMVTSTLVAPEYETFWFKFLGVNNLSLSTIKSTASVSYADAKLLKTDVTFHSTEAGFHSIVGIYETYIEDEQKLIRNAKILIEDQHNYENGDKIGSFDNPDTKFFIIADGAQDGITPDSEILMSLENSVLPEVYIDGSLVTANIYYEDTEFNNDGFEHFRKLDDSGSGFDRYIFTMEDLPSGGDVDFNDVDLSTQEIRIPSIVTDTSLISIDSQVSECPVSCVEGVPVSNDISDIGEEDSVSFNVNLSNSNEVEQHCQGTDNRCYRCLYSNGSRACDRYDGDVSSSCSSSSGECYQCLYNATGCTQDIYDMYR